MKAKWSILLLLLVSTTAFAGPAEQAQMAKILMGLHHFPSGEEQAALTALAGDESLESAERTIAGVLARVKHFPSAEDKEALSAIASDESQPQSVRDLARILHDLQHQVGDEDKARLAAIAGGS